MNWMRERRSICRYRAGAAAGRRSIERLLDAARFAPSAHNRQPWRFVGAADAETKGAPRRQPWARGCAPTASPTATTPVAIERDVATLARPHHRGARGHRRLLLRSPTWTVIADARRAEAERLMAVQSTAMAVQNLLLARRMPRPRAPAGCAPAVLSRHGPSRARSAVRLAARRPLVTLGCPATAGRRRDRRALAEFVR